MGFTEEVALSQLLKDREDLDLGCYGGAGMWAGEIARAKASGSRCSYPEQFRSARPRGCGREWQRVKPGNAKQT